MNVKDFIGKEVKDIYYADLCLIVEFTDGSEIQVDILSLYGQHELDVVCFDKDEKEK